MLKRDKQKERPCLWHGRNINRRGLTDRRQFHDTRKQTDYFSWGDAMRTSTINPDLLHEEDAVCISRLQLGQWKHALIAVELLAEMLSDGHVSAANVDTLTEMIATVHWEIELKLSEDKKS